MFEGSAFIESMERFFLPDATHQENLDPPRVGLSALIANERRALARVKEIRAKRKGPVFVDGDHVVINWLFEFESADGVTFRLDELAYQTWKGDKIASERFYYDPKQTRTPST